MVELTCTIPLTIPYDVRYRRVDAQESRKVARLVQALNLEQKFIRDWEESDTSDRRLSFRGFRFHYPNCPMLLTFELAFAAHADRRSPFQTLLSSYQDGVLLKLYAAVFDYLCAKYWRVQIAPIGMVFQGPHNDGYIMHEDERFCESACIRWRHPRPQVGIGKWVYIQKFGDFVPVLAARWPERMLRKLDSRRPHDEEFLMYAHDDTIRWLVARRGITQSRLAELLSVSSPLLSNCLNGRKRWQPERRREALLMLRDLPPNEDLV